ncbi:hypothetical protein HDE_01462 [Halotydeus destructor]|nr:hypothetical protein HDE_01462 [Halotydeus destructor]
MMLRAQLFGHVKHLTTAVSKVFQDSNGGKVTDIINMASVWTNPSIPYKFGYTDVMPSTPDHVVSPHDSDLLLQYWPSVLLFRIPDVNCVRDAFKQFTSGSTSWTTADLERHDDLLYHESNMFGRQDSAERRLYSLLSYEAVFLVDDITEQLMLSGNKKKQVMALDFVAIIRDIISGRTDELEERFSSQYKHEFPEEYETCKYLADFNARLYQGFKKTMSSQLLKVVSDAYVRSYNSNLDEYQFWKDANSKSEHATLEQFVKIKTGASFYSATGLTSYYDTDIQYIHFDHPMLILSSLMNQACNDLYSYPKEQKAGLNPFNMIQKAIMKDKMSMKDALVSNIHRRNEYMKTLEISYNILQGAAKTAAEAPLKTMASWERYTSTTRRYGWTDIGTANN